MSLNLNTRALTERLFIYPIGHVTNAVNNYIKENDIIIANDPYIEIVLLKKIILYNLFNMLGSEFGVHAISIEDFNSGNAVSVQKLIHDSLGLLDKQVYRYCRDIASTLTDHNTTIYIDILLIGNNIHIYTF